MSYSHKDRDLAHPIVAHLRLLEPELLNVWFDGDLRPTENWVEKISDNLDGADFVVLLLSSDYFASTYCLLEMERARQFEAAGTTKIVPVALRRFRLPDGIAQIQTILAGNPLAEWSDMDAGCTQITHEVEKVVRTLGGLEPKDKLAHPNRKELARLLDFLCDRNPQYQDLAEKARPDVLDPRWPFVIVTHGVKEDSHERFLDRLEYRLLPEFFGNEARRLSPLKWPDYRTRRMPHELFGPQFAACLSGVKPWSGVNELNTALQRCGRISVLPTTVSAENWGDEGHTLFQLYFQFWHEWPRLPDERILIPVLQIKYGSDEKVNLAMRESLERLASADVAAGAQEEKERQMRESPERLAGADSRRESAQDIASTRRRPQRIVLQPFREIFRPDMEDWVGQEQVRSLLASHAVASEKLSTVFLRDGMGWRMQPLAERQLPKFLSAL